MADWMVGLKDNKRVGGWAFHLVATSADWKADLMADC